MNEDEDQEAVIAFLSQPETLDSSGPVERIDTHGAIVFLTPERVFKLKRAVRYPYLDFSTAEKRRAVCEAELRLNRRTAPDLYLEVRAINRTADGSLGFGPGEPVDWLVVMRRFADEDLLEAVAARGELDPARVRALADHIAAFHAEAEVVTVHDGAARVRAVIDGNRASMAACEDAILPPNDCEALHEASLNALESIAPLLDARGADGHVRHCHGDLHLANICLWHGKPTLFDCLEFDPELARTDVLYDLAFLIMDLWERGLREQASLAFNRYCDMTGEREGVAALPLFLSMRAAVRAHVNAQAAGQQNDPAEKEAKRKAARDYLAAARALLDQPPPRLIAIGGLSGTGKSTLAGKLAPEIGGAPGARWLRTDVLRKRLAGPAPEERLPPDAYTPEASARLYRCLLDEAGAMLEAGRSVVVDGVFARADEREGVTSVAQARQTAFTGLWLDAPESLLETRVKARIGDASDADTAVVRIQQAYDVGALDAWQRIDASGSVEAVVEVARRAAG